MATVRKLQAEIDKTFRKVDEQQEVFQQVFDRLHECDQSLKEKYEVYSFDNNAKSFTPKALFFPWELGIGMEVHNCFLSRAV